MNCRFCDQDLNQEFVDLGYSPPSNAFLNKEQLHQPETYYPLKLMVCEQCLLVQIDEFASHSALFNQDYVYFSSYSTSWLAHAERYTAKMIAEFSLNEDSNVIEIASNDGYLLQFFKNANIPVLGIEPTDNTASVAHKKGIETIVDFFGASLAKKLSSTGVQADLLLGNNVLAHVPNLNDFVSGLKILLKPEGIITMEFPHLLELIDKNQFDTIYHEHFSYFSLQTVLQVFNKHQLEIFDVEQIQTHGGSLRIYVRHADNTGRSVTSAVKDLVEKETKCGLSTIDGYQGFQIKADNVKNDFFSFLVTAKKEGKSIAAYGAAAKGNTLLNYAGIKKDLIQFVSDASPHKQGKYLPGSHIPVVNEDTLKREQPDYIIIFPWNIKEEIMDQLSYVKNWGGQFIISIPSLEVL